MVRIVERRGRHCILIIAENRNPASGLVWRDICEVIDLYEYLVTPILYHILLLNNLHIMFVEITLGDMLHSMDK